MTKNSYIEKVEDKSDLSTITWDDVIDSINTEELSRQDAEALAYLVVGHTIPDAANRAGMDATTLRRHLKDNKIMQEAINQKKKLVFALLIHKMRKRMMKAMDISEDFLMLDTLNTDMTRDQISLHNKQINHAEWVIQTFINLMKSNPLENLNIVNEGDGNISVMLNVEGKSALDYISQQMSEDDTEVKKSGKMYVGKYDDALLDDRGLPNYGTFGSWTLNEDGDIQCHVCGEFFGSKQAFVGHIGSHGIDKDIYKNTYNILWEEL